MTEQRPTTGPGPLATTAPRPRWYARRPAAWATPGFRTLARAWVVTNLADSALYLMAAVWVKELTGSDGAAALVFAALGLPALFAPLLGQLADRMSRRTLLTLTYGGIAAVVLVLLLVRSAEQVGIVYAVLLVYGAVGYLTASAQSGLLRDLLADEELASGNGLLSTLDQAFRLVSPLAGAALYALAGPHAVVVTTAVLFAVAAVLMSRVRVTESEPESAAERGGWWQELTAGFRHLAASPPLGRLTTLMAVAFGATGLANVAVFPVMEQGLGVPAETLGLLVSVQGIGALAAGATAAWAIGRWGEARVFGLGLVGLGVAMGLLVMTSLPVVLAALALVGAGVTWTVVGFVTMRQRLTPPRLQGRTSAAANMATNLPQTVLTLIGAGVVAQIDYRLLLVATAVAVLGAAATAPWRTGATAPG